MSLYHEAAQILTTASDQGGSLKSIVFGNKSWKSDRKTLFALSIEAAKWSEVLSEVIERSEVLGAEKTLTPVLCLVLTHDLLLSKKGVALPAKHGLHASIARHKGRLTSELTKARLRRECATLDALREQVNYGSLAYRSDYVHPRWIRINTLLTSLDEELETTFKGYREISSVDLVTGPNSSKEKIFHRDSHIPDLIAVAAGSDLSSSKAYKEGKLIFQEKASCFPAYLLNAGSIQGDVIDACAAPGNKTTHLAAIVNASSQETSDRKRKIFACEKDAARSETLSKMVKLAGAGDAVKVRARQDFLKLDPHAPEFAAVEALLLDPSCSGSGIVGRDEATVTIHLPSRSQQKQPHDAVRGKKRKRGQEAADVKVDTAPEPDAVAEEVPSTATEDDAAKLSARLANLSSFQLRLLLHAMKIPSAKRITYSTCSLHNEENENVVVRALLSNVAQGRGWRILRREEQVEGMRIWGLRGSDEAVQDAYEDVDEEHEVYYEWERDDVEEVAEACIRCEKGGEGGTMGFFVAGFVRDGNGNAASNGKKGGLNKDDDGEADGAVDEEEWEGFSEGES